MRRLVTLIGMGALLVVVAAGMAIAITKTCNDRLPCEGTERDDVLYERLGADQDRIKGLDGRDVIDANTFDPDKDILLGGAGRDRLLSNDTDQNDLANGGRGRDTCYVNQRDRVRSCEVVRRAIFRAGTSDVSADLARGAFGR